MAYKDLYDFAQDLKTPVSRNKLRDKAIEIAGVPKVAHAKTGMDLGLARGFWLTPNNTEHHLVRQLGCHIVVTARELNRCWERIVYIKELMHLFDEEDELAATPQMFDDLLAEFASQGPVDRSPQMKSEMLAVWRALALLCPENQRLEFAAERKGNRIDDYEIALRLKIPQIHVPKLFGTTFDAILAGMK